MIVLIHDLPQEKEKQLLASYQNPPLVVADNGTILHCLGCFGCWTKEPGICILEDRYRKNGALLGSAKEVHIVSRCFYGGFSPFIKNVLDRSISYVHPDFCLRQGRTHHRLRYHPPFSLRLWFYGRSITAAERATAKKLARANSINMGCSLESVIFTEDILSAVGGSF